MIISGVASMYSSDWISAGRARRVLMLGKSSWMVNKTEKKKDNRVARSVKK